MRWLGVGLLLIMVAACSGGRDDAVVVPTLFVLPTQTEIIATETPPPTATPTDSPTPTQSPTERPTREPTATFSPTPQSSSTPLATTTLTPAPTLGTQVFGAAAGQVDQQAIVQTIADMVNFYTRHTNSARSDGRTGIDTARSYLLSRLATIAAQCSSPAEVIQDAFFLNYRNVPSTQTNFVLWVEGQNPTKAPFLIGAHYDTISKDPTFNPYGEQPGANDNGSGVSSVLELARIVCLEPRSEDMVFVLFAAEEVRPEEDGPGRVGSRHFVNDFAPSQGWRFSGMINLDTIGSATDVNGAIRDDVARLYSASPTDSISRQLARQIQASSYVQFPEFTLLVENREDRQNRWGDHISFSRAGIPSARLFEGSEDVDRQDTVQDDLNDIDPDYLIQNLQVTLAFLLGWSEGFAAPQNISVNGGIVIWDAVPEVQGYLIAQRRPSENGYTFTIQDASRRGIELPPDTFFAVGSIGSNGVLGMLSPEFYVSP